EHFHALDVGAFADDGAVSLQGQRLKTGMQTLVGGTEHGLDAVSVVLAHSRVACPEGAASNARVGFLRHLRGGSGKLLHSDSGKLLVPDTSEIAAHEVISPRV